MYWIRIRFKRACPPALIILKPSYCCRFGRQFKMYDRVIPTQLLDVTDIIRYDRTEYSRIQKCAPPWIRIRAVFTRWNYQFLKERKKKNSSFFEKNHQKLYKNNRTWRKFFTMAVNFCQSVESFSYFLLCGSRSTKLRITDPIWIRTQIHNRWVLLISKYFCRIQIRSQNPNLAG